MKLRVPPEIAWPLFVVALLLSSLGTGAAVVYFAGSDGGVQLVQEQPAAQSPDTGSDQETP
ncbi:MAG: hypothetical protein HKN29_15580 [Rhodothermales bacterium]|nr:hypothetical protein [Rhodothermales bacterium]